MTTTDLDPTGEPALLVNVEQGLVNRKIFSDPDVYQQELEQVFARCWLYLGHESQLPNPGDYINVFMGEEPVLVVRNRQGKLNAFINSCRHRGNRVCRADGGNTAAFLCTYHGWTYDLEGKLIGVPGHQELYHGELNRGQWGLPQVAQVASYKGLIFGTFDPDAPSLDEYLGDMRWGLDMLLDQGDMVAVPGIVRWQMNVNWKFPSDNAIGDTYHGRVSHLSAVVAGHTGANTTTAANARPPAIGKRPGMSMVMEYGHGLNADYIDESRFNWDAPGAYWMKDPETVKRLGPMRSRIPRSNQNVFPNLFVNSGSRELMLRNPLGPRKLEIWKTTLIDRNAPPEAARAQLFGSNRHFGPGGVFEQDDGENWDQSTNGSSTTVARRYDLNYSMSLGYGEVVEDELSPPRIETITNEHCQLWLYRCWAEYMAAPSWKHLREHHSRPHGQRL